MSKDPKKTSLVEHGGAEGAENQPYPKSVFFIIGNEFCERFSYYGMKAILTLFLINYLLFDNDNATMIYHIFSMACYFTPIIGAIISDSLLGKFRTIFYISIIYAIGNIVLAVSGIPTIGEDKSLPVAMLGLALIAFGTGGIKPCVAAFGGDQFGPGQEQQLEKFFSFFYISINAGSLISTFITPILRADVKCFEKECFSLAFGIPAGLMVVALVLFLIGKPLYKINPPEGNIMVRVMSCIGHALKTRSSSHVKKDHWLDHAEDKYDKKLIEDVKSVLKVLFLYLPLPFFWALFDQQGSRWTIQATLMDGRVTDNWRIQPDQMQVINPLLIVAFIPIFQWAIYPGLATLRIARTPLQRMTIGGLLAAGAFVIAFFVELKLETTMPELPEAGYGHVHVINGMPNCDLNLTFTNYEDSVIIPANDMTVFKKVDLKSKNVTARFPCTGDGWTTPFEFRMDQEKETSTVATLFVVGPKETEMFNRGDNLKKPGKGNSDVAIYFQLNQTTTNNTKAQFTLKYKAKDTFKLDAIEQATAGDLNFGYTNYTNIDPEKGYNLRLDDGLVASDLEFLPGGKYVLLVGPDYKVQKREIIQANSLSLFIQIPQYVVITFGEIMFSITGLEFSYSQAPSSMKSVLQAGWLMTVAFGNLIVVLIAKFALMKQSLEFIMFAGLMVLDMLIFAIMAYYYKPVDLNAYSDQQAPEMPEKPHLEKPPQEVGQDNPAFTNDATTKM